jgi:hypothetical protein
MSKKTLYQSELIKLGLVAAKILSEPQDSQFPGKPRWVAMEVNGEERYYNCESVACEDALRGLKGQVVSLEAQGTREDATLNITQTVTKEEEKPKLVGDANGQIKKYAAFSGKVFGAAWDEAQHIMAKIPEKDAEEMKVWEWYDLRLRIAQGFAIEVNKIIRKERF